MWFSGWTLVNDSAGGTEYLSKVTVQPNELNLKIPSCPQINPQIALLESRSEFHISGSLALPPPFESVGLDLREKPFEIRIDTGRAGCSCDCLEGKFWWIEMQCFTHL